MDRSLPLTQLIVSLTGPCGLVGDLTCMTEATSRERQWIPLDLKGTWHFRTPYRQHNLGDLTETGDMWKSTKGRNKQVALGF